MTGLCMEQINTIELADASVYPDENVLRRVLGRSYKAYCSLLELFEASGLTYDWRYYKDGKAWLCKVENTKKTIVWMSAWKGYVKATIYIPEKYKDTLDQLNISEETKERIHETTNVGKSKPCMFEITNKKVLKEFSIVMKHKMELK